ECTGYRVLGGHLAEHAHDQVDHAATDQISQDDGRPRQLNGLRRTVEQSGADGTAQCDQLNVAIFQMAPERGGRCVPHVYFPFPDRQPKSWRGDPNSAQYMGSQAILQRPCRSKNGIIPYIYTAGSLSCPTTGKRQKRWPA